MMEQTARGPCEIVASGRGELFIDWWTLICNIGQSGWRTPEELLEKLNYDFIRRLLRPGLYCCYERLGSPLSLLRWDRDDQCSVWSVVTNLRYLRSTSRLEPGKLPTFGNISYCIDLADQFSVLSSDEFCFPLSYPADSGSRCWVIATS